jgi:hypothetical protein
MPGRVTVQEMRLESSRSRRIQPFGFIAHDAPVLPRESPCLKGAQRQRKVLAQSGGFDQQP